MALAVLLAAASMGRFLNTQDRDVTSEVAALATAGLGILAVEGSMVIAAATATIMVALLDMKPRLHQALTRIEPIELRAAIQLAVLSVVILPLLPNRGIGPGHAINPYQLWWLVVIVAAISFVGYAAVKIAGQRFGLLITGFFAGIVSSTALTVSLSRRARQGDLPMIALAASIAMATGTMFVRLLILVFAVRPELGRMLAMPFAATALGAYAAAFVFTRRSPTVAGHPAAAQDPLDLTTAMLFSVLLAAITILVHYAKIYAGDLGIYAIAFFGGLADVDAVSLSLARAIDLAMPVVALAIVLAALVNTVWKIGLAVVFGTVQFAMIVASVVLPALVLGGLLGAAMFFISESVNVAAVPQ